MLFSLFSILEKVDMPWENLFYGAEDSADLEHARLYPVSGDTLSRNILYIIDSSKAGEFLHFPVHLISNGPLPVSPEDTALLSFTAVPEETDLCQLFCLIQDVFFSYCH